MARFQLPKFYNVKDSYPYLTFAVILSFIIFEIYPIPAPFERGIEYVRSRGFEIDGDSSLSDHAVGGSRVFERTLQGFVRLCVELREDEGSVVVMCDVDEKVLFLVVPGGDAFATVYLCRFR